MLAPLTQKSVFLIKDLRFQAPPNKRATETAPQPPPDSVLLSSDADQARTRDYSPDQGRNLKLGMFTALSLVGGFCGLAAQRPKMFLEQPLEKADPSGLVDPSESRGTRNRLSKQISVLDSTLIESLLESGLTIKTASGVRGMMESGALEGRDPTTYSECVENEAAGLNRELGGAMAATDLEEQAVASTEGRWRVYRHEGKPSDEITVEEIAREHGFRSETEVAWFVAQVEAANADRLSQARKFSLDRTRHESTQKGRKGRKASARLEEWQADPARITFSHRLNPLLVPDFHRVEAAGKTFHGTLHDKQTFDLWQNPQHKLGGQYFGEGDQHLILITPHGLQNDHTVIHEIGHALERMAQRNSPEEFPDFMTRLRKAHDGIKPAGRGRSLDPDRGRHHDDLGRKQISDYSRTNHREYLAEGYAHYIDAPEKLQKEDPVLFKLMEELVELAVTGGEVGKPAH